ncbi:MAG: hypothetical protein DF168_02107 [Candidatus Moanabacter tarae]|uniref:Uncharacterized protein n=1 Tax=Candidatus Moanibacter tarae TaxID=2200854 RepID=A0A2Z4ARZ5_9BACT|nr:MAG: hypothetical protein DF168_02107 [Candidatus Moanabacter tarae]
MEEYLRELSQGTFGLVPARSYNKAEGAGSLVITGAGGEQ